MLNVSRNLKSVKLKTFKRHQRLKFVIHLFLTAGREYRLSSGDGKMGAQVPLAIEASSHRPQLTRYR